MVTDNNGQEVLSTQKLFVLDTNVLMHDPTSLFHFEEHDVYLPMIVLEELDHQKKGMGEAQRNARETSRLIDALMRPHNKLDGSGIPLILPFIRADGNLIIQDEQIDIKLPVLPGSNDNSIIGIAKYLQDTHATHQVILVSKDINMRIKAKACGVLVEDYFNDKSLEDSDILPKGSVELSHDFWTTHDDLEAWHRGGEDFYNVANMPCDAKQPNTFVYLESPERRPFFAVVDECRGSGTILRVIHPERFLGKDDTFGIYARNREQAFALHALRDPNIDFITLLGVAGTGKTLMTLAAALQQTIEEKLYSEIIMTRATVPIGEDIGFLPGTEAEKMGAWMGALDDNLEVLLKPDPDSEDWKHKTTIDLLRSRIKVKSMSFFRGRTFQRKFLIIDEAQNLTPKEMKTLITRAGPDTKVVCMGNLNQIDTPYLTEGSSGLTYVVDRFRGWKHFAHITLERGERSRLADHANEVL